MPSTTSTSVWKKVQRKTKTPILYTGLWLQFFGLKEVLVNSEEISIPNRCAIFKIRKKILTISARKMRKNVQFFLKIWFFLLFMQTHPQTPQTKKGWKMAVVWSISVLFSPVAMVLQRHQVINHNWARKEIHTKAYFPTMQKKRGKNAGRRMKMEEKS